MDLDMALDINADVDVDDSLATLKTYTLSGSMERDADSKTSDTNYGSDSLDALDAPDNLWPEKWDDASARGRWIARRMDNDTLYDFLYAKAGTYETEIPPLKNYSVPALKMVSAVPGYRPGSADQAKRVTIFPSYLA
eukprot:CAMPEP_0171171980 /NCGR_PEP_ID=MMETSP0790-20130122/9489_1 /TAXON_ID=2925 /ORGANISM="Alexandrium catenella, Strain OF101" /LENGTH=136 /DNA_ID=CAMNT_0011636835 /DNA_START=157 /DNA_END=563 /DNA_ORIENTATION=+